MTRPPTRCPARCLTAAAVLLACSALAPAQEQHGFPDGFEVVPLPGTFDLPVDLAFRADGTFFVGTKAGVVHYHDRGAVQAAEVLNLRDEVNAFWDLGLLSITLSPRFSPDAGPSSWLYLLFAVTPEVGSDWTPGQDDRHSFSRLVRYRVDTVGGDLVAVPSSRQVLLGKQLPDGTVPDGIASLSSSHSTGSLLFADDGSLFVLAGDGALFGGVDAGGLYPGGFSDFVHPVTGLRGPIPADQDCGAFRSQDLRSLSGKVLRIDPESGEGYPSNPFFDGDPKSNASRVWALGMRNPFRACVIPGTSSLDPADGMPNLLYVGDVGWSQWEELNLVGGGDNFGWPCWEGALTVPSYGTVTHSPNPLGFPDCQAPGPGSQRAPALAWHHFGITQVYPPGIHVDEGGQPAGGFRGECAIGGVFYEGGSYPDIYRGRYFFADYSAGWLRTLETDAGHLPTAARDFGTNLQNLCSLHLDPDSGDVHFLRLDGDESRVWHLRYTTNATPVADAAAAPEFGDAPLTVQFDASASFDPDQEALVYSWDFGDGSPPSSAVAPQHTYTQDGVYSAVLTVTDPGGASSTDERSIAVGNSPPVATILSPVMGEAVVPPVALPLVGAGVDAQDTDLSYEWAVDLVHDLHEHPDVFSATDSTTCFDVPEHGAGEELTYLRIRLRVTDSGGLSDEAEVYVYERRNLVDVTGTAIPIARIFGLSPPNPQGSGNRDIEIVRDGVLPPLGSAVPAAQFDTYHSGGHTATDWIGYELPGPAPVEARFAAVTFQEGIHFDDGGWFEDLDVEVRSGDRWQSVEQLVVTPAYQPVGSANYESYQLAFEPRMGDAIRLIGPPGGTAGFLSVGELRVSMVQPVSPPERRDVTGLGSIVARVFELDPPVPTGAGNKNPETIRNGTWPSVGSESTVGQFDTEHGGDQGGSDWVGYTFQDPQVVEKLVFQEGLHTAAGGRLLSLGVQVQLAAGGPWVPAAGVSVTPPYPGSPDLADTYETFEILLTPTEVYGVRLEGPPEGSVGFLSVGELRVLAPAVDPCAGSSVTSYCTTSPHSAGPGATIVTHNCASVSATDFELELAAAPAGVAAIFFYGDAQISTPFGDGVRCVAGTSGRLEPPFVTDASGHGHYVLDFTDPPSPSTAITAGSTWNFQAWFRDPGGPGGSGFNLSDGLQVTFLP